MAVDQLSLHIEKMAKQHGSYIDAIVEYSKLNEIDFEDILEVLNKNVVDKTRQEFITKNFIPSMKSENSIMSFMKD